MCNITQKVLVACCPDWPVIIKLKAFYLFILFIAYFKTSPSNFYNRFKKNKKTETFLLSISSADLWRIVLKLKVKIEQ